MGEKGTHKGPDQRGKASKRRHESAGQSSADESDDSSQAPSRVHIFRDKSQPADPPKSADEPVRYSLHRAGPVGPRAAVLADGGFHRSSKPIFNFKEELIRFKHGIEKGTRALYEAAIKAEDLEGLIQGMRQNRERVVSNRKAPKASSP